MALPAPLQALYDRIFGYNGDAYNQSSNPQGFARGGNQPNPTTPLGNFIAALRDFAAFGKGVADIGSDAVAAAADVRAVKDAIQAGPVAAVVNRTGIITADHIRGAVGLDVQPSATMPVLDIAPIEGTQPAGSVFARAGVATRRNRAGLLESVAAGALRVDYSGGRPGWLIEGARTRLNTIALAPTAAETVTVTAQAYTVSFSGTGSVALSGAASQTIAGAGAYPARKAVTFTPTAGSLTLTPSGSVTDLQLEAGGFASSVIRGEGGAVTRAAETFSRPLEPGFNVAEFSAVVRGRTAPGIQSNAAQAFWQVDDATNGNRVVLRRDTDRVMRLIYVVGGTADFVSAGTVPDNTDFAVAFAASAAGVSISLLGAAVVADTSATLPVGLTTERFGTEANGSSPAFGLIYSVQRFNTRLPDAELVARSSASFPTVFDAEVRRLADSGGLADPMRSTAAYNLNLHYGS